MKKITIAACAAALSSLVLAQMTAPADARSRHKRTSTTKSMSTSKTGGLNSSPSAAGGNSSSPAQPGARGSAGGSNSN
ncbi:hypothetical protein [Methylobacterium brachythecii]|uniref:Uncharacterized protein n=1 Tax=Methylobacterium brachythecii TaxID=1176177 RepID=A0A7W6AIH2_9HYPH|nr:hypothetical protein [Methylobacterium brachythecii]MBB3903985.1 hypothetical protein [Methylobacterium brachythecii]